MLDRGDAAVLAAPYASFYGELERLPASSTPFRAVISTNYYSEETLQTELADLRAALRAGGKSSNDVERIVASHLQERMKLEDFAYSKPREDGDEVDSSAKPPAKPAFPAVTVVDGLPAEFADYFEGVIAWKKPGETGRDAARQAWERLLDRPPEERHYKSTFAAYMLAQSWEQEDAEKARSYYKQVRALASQGFADPAGLAASGIGWEARLALDANEFETAIDLYLQQYAAGGLNAAESLRFTVSRAINAGPKAFVPLVANPQARRLVTAYLICRHPFDDTTSETIHESTKAWLQAVEQANVKDMESAEQFALAAYQADDMESALRWVNRAGNSPTAQWLTAKLLLRAGKVDKATELLSKVVNLFPTEEPTNEPESFGDGLYVPSGGEDERVSAGRYILGELGALRVSRREYVQALDLLLRGDFETDADYVADRVLTTDELKSYVDANWPELPSSDGEKSAEEKKTEETTKEIRHLLARRLTREGHGLDAESYFPLEWLPAYEHLMDALKDGWNESLPGEQRAAALRVAAYMARTNGMQLLATETEPDWHLNGGDFGWRFQTDNRHTNQEDVLVVASADELKRYAESKPDPDLRFHYRYQAARLAWEAAKLMPNNADDTARLLCDAGSWLKAQDPDAADLFYKTLVRRCRKTAIGAEADEIRWFPTFDDDGNVVRTRLEMLDLPTAQEINSTEAISHYPIPGKYFVVQDGDHIRFIASAVRRLGISMTAKAIFAANPEIKPDDNITGRRIYIPIPGSDARPEAPPVIENPAPETPSIDPNTGGEVLLMQPPVEDIVTGNSYVVQRGDSLAMIAKQYSVTIGSLAEANPNVDFRRLKIGQRMVIPVASE